MCQLVTLGHLQERKRVAINRGCDSEKSPTYFNGPVVKMLATKLSRG